MDFSHNTGKIGLLNKNRQMGFFGCQKLTKQVLIKKKQFCDIYNLENVPWNSLAPM